MFLILIFQDGMFTKATSSVPSPITNLSYHNSINTDLLIENLIKEYSKSNLKVLFNNYIVQILQFFEMLPSFSAR